jgi:long-subunit fatty acid transport protein
MKWEKQPDDSWEIMENDAIALSAGARYKMSSQMILMLGYDYPITQHAIRQPKPSINVGLEIATSSHAFQIFATNNNKIQSQENVMFNQNDYSSGDWLIGFNITRLWSF